MLIPYFRDNPRDTWMPDVTMKLASFPYSYKYPIYLIAMRWKFFEFLVSIELCSLRGYTFCNSPDSASTLSSVGTVLLRAVLIKEFFRKAIVLFSEPRIFQALRGIIS